MHGRTPDSSVNSSSGPEFWMTLQTRHDLWHAIRKVGKQTVKAIP